MTLRVWIRRLIPPLVRHKIYRTGVAIAFFVANLPRWLHIAIGPTFPNKDAQIFYGHDRLPKLNESASGGIVKFQRLQPDFPNTPRRFNILYLVSSRLPADAEQLLWLARCKGAKFLWNQNGVAYAAYDPNWQRTNRPMAQLLHAADYVFYQSAFCKRSADQFLGLRDRNWEILYNAVDTSAFTPATVDPDPQCLILLLGGSQYQFYRLETALRTLAILVTQHLNACLLVTGRLCWNADEVQARSTAEDLIQKLGLCDRVTFLGPYSQTEAPAVLQRSHILLHTKYNDPCPGLVVEAMACGLPVVYSCSGGVPELVGTDAGVGIPAELSWGKDCPPDPNALAEAVLQVAAQRKMYAEAARTRAVEKFDIQPWIERHRQVFSQLLAQ